MPEISSQEIVLQRLARNGLSAPFAEPIDCVRCLVGIQSQFQQWAEVSIMNRCSGAITMQDLSHLYAGHNIINLWGQRHTLHMYVKEDWPTMSDLFEPVVSGKNYANKRFPDDFAFLMDQITEVSSKQHRISKATVLAMIEERMQGRHSEKDYFEYMFIALSCLRGIFFGLPEKPGIKTFIHRNRIYIKPWRENKARTSTALVDVLSRYFRYYGPASLADFSHWAGLPQGVAKRAISTSHERFATFTCEDREYFTHGEPAGIVADDVFLLGKFDPLFVSYRHKDWIIPATLQKQVWRNAGWVEAVIVDTGKAVGTWRHTMKGRKMSVQVNLFQKVKAASRKKIQARAERLAAFWEKQLDSITYA